MAKLISPYGGTVHVSDERVEGLLATGYRSADAKASAPAPAKDEKPARKTSNETKPLPRKEANDK